MSTYDPGRTLWAHLGWTGRRDDPRDGPRYGWRLVQQSPERWALVDAPAQHPSPSRTT